VGNKKDCAGLSVLRERPTRCLFIFPPPINLPQSNRQPCLFSRHPSVMFMRHRKDIGGFTGSRCLTP